MIKWALETGNAICIYSGHKGGINNVYRVNQKLLTTSQDGSVRVWSRRIEEDKFRWYNSNKAMSQEEQAQKLGWYSGGGDSPQTSKSKGKKGKAAPPPKSAEESLAWYM